MHCHRILVSALCIDMSSLLTSFISKKYFYFHLFPLVFVHCQMYIFFGKANANAAGLSPEPESTTKVGGVAEQQEDQSQTNTNVGDQEGLNKYRSYENSVVNMNVGNQEMLDKDYYENSHEKDSAGPWEQRPRK